MNATTATAGQDLRWESQSTKSSINICAICYGFLLLSAFTICHNHLKDIYRNVWKAKMKTKIKLIYSLVIKYQFQSHKCYWGTETFPLGPFLNTNPCTVCFCACERFVSALLNWVGRLHSTLTYGLHRYCTLLARTLEYAFLTFTTTRC